MKPSKRLERFAGILVWRPSHAHIHGHRPQQPPGAARRPEVIRRFLRLPAKERALILRLVLLVAAIRLALWTVSFARVQRLLRRPFVASAVPSGLVAGLPVDRLEWAVRAASRRVPDATCLTQSLALQFLLARSGRASALRIGVARRGVRGFQAHAWVECEGHTLLDRSEDVAEYTLLASWEST